MAKQNNIHIIYADLSPLYSRFEYYLSKLPDKRQHRIGQLRDFNTKADSLGGALLLEIAASRFGVDTVDVRYTEKGKPYIENSDFYFSISHSHGYAACSYGRVPSGCDIQVEKNVNLKIAERFFTEKEKQLVFDAPNPEHEFFRLWCRKESAYKLLGVNDCIVRNTHKLFFKDFMVSEGIYLNACAVEDKFENPEKIDLNTAF